jgi:hypothetical protein
MSRRSLSFALAAALVVAGGLVAQRAHSSATAAQQKARLDAAKQGFTLAKSSYSAGVQTAEVYCAWSRRLYDADLASGSSTAAADYVTRARTVETEIQTRVQQGGSSRLDALTAAYYRSEAEILAAGP